MTIELVEIKWTRVCKCVACVIDGTQATQHSLLDVSPLKESHAETEKQFEVNVTLNISKIKFRKKKSKIHSFLRLAFIPDFFFSLTILGQMCAAPSNLNK